MKGKDSAKPRYGNGLWMMDMALLLLGSLVLYLVLNLLRFDDPNPVLNAWTYVLGVPTVLIAVSMLTHVLSNEFVERSIQVGFLSSVSIHLLLALCAIHLVLFRGYWPSDSTKVEIVASREQSRTPQYYQPSPSASSVSRPDYLKPVPTDNQTPSEVQAEKKKINDSAQLQLDLANDSLQTKIAEKTFERDRPKESIPQPTITSSSKELNRPDLSSNKRSASERIEVPSLDVSAVVPKSDPQPLETQVDRTERVTQERSSISPGMEMTESTSQPKLRAESLRKNDNRSKQVDRQLENALASQTAVSQSQVQVRPTETNASLDRPSLSAIPIPKLGRMESMGSDVPEQPSTADVERSQVGVTGIRSTPSLRSDIGPKSDFAPAGTVNRNVPKRNASPNRGDDFLSDPRFAADSISTGRRSSSSTPSRSSVGSPIPLEGIASAPASSSDGTDTGMADPTAAEMATRSGEVSKSNASGRPSDSLSTLSSETPDLGKESWTSPRPDLPKRGLGMVENSLALPELKESDFAPQRFKRPDLSGPKIAASSVPIPTPAFSQRLKRMSDRESEAASEMGPLGPQTELAIERGLQFLAKYQRVDGSWHLEDFGEPVRMQSNTAATALALLSFQGAGYTHRQFKYEGVCKSAVQWLVDHQSPDGDLYERGDSTSNANAWLYSHAMASLALCEAFGMTQDESIRDNAQRAIDFLVQSQDPIGGGWRYVPRIGSDTSVTGWVMMAFKSAELSGLKVPRSTYDGIERWLQNSQAKDNAYLFRYNWQANTPTTQHGRIPTPVMTSVGLLMRLYTGWKRDNINMQQGTDWLLQRPPSLGTLRSPARDTYYWYYATQVMFHAGGNKWKSWYGALYPMLIRTQETNGEYAGSWNPGGEIPDAWAEYGGRLYVTTLNLLSLEVYYRHLPLYEATAQ